MKSLCLTLFLFCQTTFNTFDFSYSNKQEFVQGIYEEVDKTLLLLSVSDIFETEYLQEFTDMKPMSQ